MLVTGVSTPVKAVAKPSFIDIGRHDLEIKATPVSSGGAKFAPRAINVEQGFPMYVLPIRAVVERPDDAPPPTHETIYDELVEWKPGMNPVVFVVHACTAADKIASVKALLKSARDGALDVTGMRAAALFYGGSENLSVSTGKLSSDLQDGFVWMDVASVPQVDKSMQGLALASISRYVASASYFVRDAYDGNAGGLHDWRAWSRRGLARVENLAKALSPALIAELVDERKAHALKTKELTWYRMLQSVAPSMLEQAKGALGLAPPVPPLGVSAAPKAEPETWQEWLTMMRFSSLNEESGSGLTPLLFAVLAGKEAFVKDLLERGANPKCAVSRTYTEFSLAAGSTPLHVACVVRDDPAIVGLLLQHGADPWARDATGTGDTALHAASGCGRIACVGTLLAHDLQLGGARNHFGVLPIEYAAIYGHADVLSHYVTAYPTVAAVAIDTTTSTGRNLAANALIEGGDYETLKVAIAAGCDVNKVGEPFGNVSWLYKFTDAMGAMSACCGRVNVYGPLSYASRCTALHIAAYSGNARAVRLLLSSGADAASTLHPKGMTPAELAEARGHPAVAQLIRSGGVGAGSPGPKSPSANGFSTPIK